MNKQELEEAIRKLCDANRDAVRSWRDPEITHLTPVEHLIGVSSVQSSKNHHVTSATHCRDRSRRIDYIGKRQARETLAEGASLGNG